MKKKIFYGVMMVAAGILSTTSCTDFDDYNEAKQDATPSANQTLWENISGDSELTHFASLLKKVGYDKVLSSANCYTVWAPVDSKLDLSKYENLDSTQLVLQFVKNHVADYSYVLSGAWAEPKRVPMQNKKVFSFVNNGACTFDDINVLSKNIASTNGIMHKIDGVTQYYPNIDAFINDTAQARTLGIDSLSAYYRKYNVSYLDEKKSVVGPIVDGKQTYIDSVMVNTNYLTGTFLSNEDSTYTMILPTNDAWKDAYNKGKAYYNIAEKVPYRALDNTGNVKDELYTLSKIEYLKDSLIKENIFASLVYSNNNTYNKWLVGDQTVSSDTLRSLYRYKYSNPHEMLAPTIQDDVMSNGQVKVVNALNAHPWELFSREMVFNAYGNFLKIKSGNAKYQTVTYRNTTTGESRTWKYLDVVPSGQTSPEVEISLPGVKSDTYNVYLVLPPGYSEDIDAIDERPNTYRISMYYAKSKATTTTLWRFSSDGKENPEKENGQATYDKDNTVLTSLDERGLLKTDTMFVGKMTIPVSYAGTKVGPSIYVKVPFISKANQDKYSREIRIVSVILRPVAQDEYEATKED